MEQELKSKYKGQREPAKPSPEVNDARQKIADDLADYVDGHRTDQPFDTSTIRPLLDAARVLAFSAAVNDPDGSKTLDSEAAATTLTTLIRPFCDGSDLQDVVMDAVDQYLATYQQPAGDDTAPTIFEEDQAQAVFDEMSQAAGTIEDTINQITAHRVKDMDYPVDKVNNSIWNLLKENTHGQETFDIKANPDGKPDVNFTYSINFDAIKSDLPMVKKLTQYDKRTLVATWAVMYNTGPFMTETQVYHAMGYTKSPSQRDIEKIDKSLTKFGGARIHLDNRQEIDAGYKYPLFEYDGDLLSFERVRERTEINGKVTESVIHVLAEPAILRFARDRDQITTIPEKLLQTPINKTELNLGLEDYLIERIARAKNKKKHQETIKYDALFDHLHLTDQKKRQQRKNVRDRVPKYLNHFKKCDYIRDFDDSYKDKVVVKF